MSRTTEGPAKQAPASVIPVAAPVPPPAARTPVKLPLPLALQDIDYTAANLNEGQIKAIETLRKKFVAEIGVGPQNPYDPAYASRWRAARPQNDLELRTKFGGTFADRVALEAAQQEYAASPEGRAAQARQ